jgi:hypothetical protein
MITEGRRRQRPIPVIEPVKNTTLEFVNVISHVFYNSRNHQKIVMEMIRHFNNSIRKRFGVNLVENDLFAMEEISALSGVELSKVRQLFKYIERLSKISEVSELELIELERQISNFNKYSLR